MNSNRGLTFVETITIIIMITFLLFFLRPAFQRYWPRPRSFMQCKSNLKQLGLMYYLYCQDNDGSFSSGIAGETERDDWLISTKPYIIDIKILKCDLAKVPRSDGNDYGGPHNTYKISIKQDDKEDILIESSYGINCWLYNPPQNSNIFASYSGANFWRTKNVSESSKIPVFVDAMWVGGYPEPDGKAGQPPEENGQWDSFDAEMKHFCIDRHSSAINMVFMDGHVEDVELKRLWKLKWHKNYDTKGKWSKSNAPWPEWMKDIKDSK